MEELSRSQTPDPLPDTLTLVSWNIGYAGLDAGMDFFMDGGTRTRTSRVQTEENLAAIGRFLSQTDADILLLEEVDRGSRRSYGVDQFACFETLLSAYHGYFAANYRSPFVPVPLRSPLGRVHSGVAIFTRSRPEEVVRYQYESCFPFPTRLFNLKRCWLAATFRTRGGERVTISATHNTAYERGDMRSIEMRQLYDFLHGRGLSITGGDWNQFPPRYTPSTAEVSDPYFTPRQILPSPDFQYVYDSLRPTVRYLDAPLSGHSTKSLIDFFLISPDIEVLERRTLDLGFRHSDHQPVRVRVILPKYPRK